MKLTRKAAPRFKRKATHLKPSTVIKRRNTKTEAACRFETSLSCHETAVRISLSVDLQQIFDVPQLALLDYEAKERIRMQIRADVQSFRMMYKRVYDNTMAKVLQRVAEYNSKVQTLLESYNFLRKAGLLIPLLRDCSKYGTIVQLTIQRNTLSMDILSQDKQELVTFKNVCTIPRGPIRDVDLEFHASPHCSL